MVEKVRPYNQMFATDIIMSAWHIGLTQITLLFRVSELDRTAQIKIFRRETRFLRKSWHS